MAACGTSSAYRQGCRCWRCREAHRVDALNRRRRRGIMPPTVRPVMDRFWEKVERTQDCWLWTGALDESGYALFKVDGRTVRPHRWLYERLVGAVPQGLQLDHLCRVRNCVNPAHLEPVTNEENQRRARKTHCIRGHEFDEENTYWVRGCRACARIRKGEKK